MEHTKLIEESKGLRQLHDDLFAVQGAAKTCLVALAGNDDYPPEFGAMELIVEKLDDITSRVDGDVHDVYYYASLGAPEEISAPELIAEVIGQQCSAGDDRNIENLYEALMMLLVVKLDGFDYRGKLSSTHAVDCRVLAACLAMLERHQYPNDPSERAVWRDEVLHLVESERSTTTA